MIRTLQCIIRKITEFWAKLMVKLGLIYGYLQWPKSFTAQRLFYEIPTPYRRLDAAARRVARGDGFLTPRRAE
jgi:hypothetical protein